MARHFIKDSGGKDQRDSQGRRQFYSDSDGDSKPDTKQTTYSESKSIWGGSTKNESTYNPSSGKWNDSSSDSGSSDSGSSGGGCFLSTACTAARGLPDDCELLTTLRTFRDGLVLQPHGKQLVEDYYLRAPIIVDAVNARPDAYAAWSRVYEQVQDIATLIRAGEADTAEAQYRHLTDSLWTAYVLRVPSS